MRAGLVLVDGRPVSNPSSRVRADASVVVQRAPSLRGRPKLEAALLAFDVPVVGRVAADLGAAAGGFTTALLAAGARRVYSVDAGHGQLLGSLRQDTRVVNLEGTNIAALESRLVPEPVDVVTMDLSYLALADAAPYVEQLTLAPGADLLALVKPMFELGLAVPPTADADLERAMVLAISGFEANGWRAVANIRSPVDGARGAKELLLHAVRAS